MCRVRIIYREPAIMRIRTVFDTFMKLNMFKLKFAEQMQQYNKHK